MTKAERYAEYRVQFDTLKGKYHWDRIKPNPNNWPIINKWNTKYIYNPSGRDLFTLLEHVMDTEMKIEIGESFDDMVKVKEIIKPCNTTD